MKGERSMNEEELKTLARTAAIQAVRETQEAWAGDFDIVEWAGKYAADAVLNVLAEAGKLSVDATVKLPQPDVSIQWKGTDACIDFNCTCGAYAHFDGYFGYAFECGACGAKWENPYRLQLVPLRETDPGKPILLTPEEN